MAYPEDNFHGARGFLTTGKRGPGGRKPKLIKAWIKTCNVNRDDAANLLKSVLFEKTLPELVKIIETEGDTISVATYALVTAMIGSAKKGDYRTIREMLEFLYGKVPQQIEVSGGSAAVVVLPQKEITEDERADDDGMETPAETGGGAAIEGL